MREYRWHPGDPHPAKWDLPTACPAGHPWGPGYVHSSWISRERGFTVFCYQPNSPHRACPWKWEGLDTSAGGQWGRKQMSGRWNPADGTELPTDPDDVEVLVDGQWRRGFVHAWMPVPGDGWEADVGVDMGAGWPDIKMRVRPDRVRRESWQSVES